MDTVITTSASTLEQDLDARRLQLLEQHADPMSARRLAATGLRQGWRCLEVGAGRGSIASWLAEQVGPRGQVTAVDVDTTLLAGVRKANLNTICGDMLDVKLPEGHFDLIHTRCVLMHIAQRRRALERLVSWLRPGGWLLAEELDSMALQADFDPSRVAIFNALAAAFPMVDFQCGRALLRELDAAGLTSTAAEITVDVVEGATGRARWDQLSIQALIDQILNAGTATAEQVDEQLKVLEQRGYRALGWAWVAARGQRPHSGKPRFELKAPSLS